MTYLIRRWDKKNLLRTQLISNTKLVFTCSFHDLVLFVLIPLIVFCFLPVHNSVPPVFRRKIHTLESSVGSPAKFECEIEDAPNVTFTWFKSGYEIRQSDKYRIISYSTTSSLELLSPTKADSGEYMCKALNQHGSDSCSANLTVAGKRPLSFCVLWHGYN